MLSLKTFRTAAITFSAIELAHRIHKEPFAVLYERDRKLISLKELSDQALSAPPPPPQAERNPPPVLVTGDADIRPVFRRLHRHAPP